jgi:hypothetical protein
MLNPWLIRWYSTSNAIEGKIPNMIAAILPGQTSEKEVGKTMLLLLANYGARSAFSKTLYVSEQVRFARRDYPYKVVNHGLGRMTCGHNLFLSAQKVCDLKLTAADDYQILTWEENIYPVIQSEEDFEEQMAKARPFKRRQFTFDSRTNRIERTDDQMAGVSGDGLAPVRLR